MGEVYLKADLRPGAAKSIEVTLSDPAGTVTNIAVPAGAEGVKLYPSADTRFAFNEEPAVKATSNTTPIAVTALAAGAIAKASMWEVRLLPGGTERTLRLMSATAGAVVEVEFF